MKHIVPLVAVIIASEGAAQAPAAPLTRVPIPATRFSQVMAVTVRQVKADYDVTWDRETTAGVLAAIRVGPGEAPRFFQAPSAVLVERAAAAINTSVQGAEAGIIVTPLSLLGVDTGPHSWTASVASLEGGRVRVTTGYTWQSFNRPGSYEELELEGCPFGQKEEDELKRDIAKLEGDFGEVCEVLVPVFPEPTAATREHIGWYDAQVACGHKPELGVPPGQIAKAYTLAFSARSINQALKRAREGLVSGSPARTNLETRVSSVEGQLERLLEFSPPAADDCISNKKLKAEAVRYGLKHSATKIGGQLLYEGFPRVFGFNPDLAEGEETPEKELPSGEWAKIGLRADLETRLFDSALVQVGLGVERGRKELDDPILWSLTPTASISRVLTVIGDKGVGGSALLVKDDGTLQPNLVAGLLFTSNIALEKVKGQQSPINELQATLYFDFRFTENLQARLGIPLKGTRVERAATDSSPVKSDVQWSVPVSITTVLKL